jgi:hypothetical protein
MVSEKQIDGLTEYRTSSWAMWREAIDEKYCKDNINCLKNNVVLLGLNQSGGDKESKETKSNFLNFHAFGHKGDGLLKEEISKLEHLRGAYMTDLSTVIESDSKKVKLTVESKKRFEEQLKILAADKFYIICFGQKVLNFLINECYPEAKPQNPESEIKELFVKTEKWELKIYGVQHYSAWLGKNKKCRDQLKTVNTLIGKDTQQ